VGRQLAVVLTEGSDGADVIFQKKNDDGYGWRGAVWLFARV
jgi:hypothetical protein